MTQSSDPAGGDRVRSARSSIGPVGFHLPTVGAMKRFPMAMQVDAVRRLERAGYKAAWNGEGIGGKDGLVELAVLLGATERMTFGTSVANMWARPAETAHGASALLADAFPGRFVLGLGPGYPFHAEMLGHTYDRPLARLREYLERMTASEADAAYPRIIAANGPKMLKLAGEIADGAQPTVVPAEYTAAARATLGAGKLLVIGLPVVPDADKQRARETARRLAAASFGRPDSPYAANLVRLGYPAEDVAAGAGHVVDAIIAHGGRDAITAKVQEHLAAGADHVMLTPMTGDYGSGVEQLEWLAPAITELAR
ncbi:TIGR03620 family F420-dependent LLM class oxidoreductase [Amycolatopsis sp. GM8]|uniref:TIGR03620 family F420-dependent LLM class oxidoreductase n=1 Tax=Amycolatopsis sp. GM8 TaxID=2896530 RepID=UPI001F2BE680|nr:TIGR03620 family F420-dependent LLM class oxidoreductase [Amycolatopsis sp. GM8]